MTVKDDASPNSENPAAKPPAPKDEISARIDQLFEEVAQLRAELAVVSAAQDETDGDMSEGQLDISPPSSSAYWTGRVMAHDGTMIKDYSAEESFPMNVMVGKYLHYDGETGATTIDDTAVDDDALTWQICELEYGSYTLSEKTSGDIVLPIPKDWDERQVLQTDKDSNDAKPKFGDLLITADDPSNPTGFTFSKPTDEDLGLSQMKVSGGVPKDVLVRTSSGAGWQTQPVALDVDETIGERFKLWMKEATESTPAKLTLEYPKFGKIVVIENPTIELDLSGGGLKALLRADQVEYDLDLYEINNLSPLYVESNVVPVGPCPEC